MVQRMKYMKYMVILAMLTGSASCTRGTQDTDTTTLPVQKTGNGNSQNTDNSNQDPTISTDLEQGNATTTNDDVVEVEMPPLCRDSAGAEISNQYQDQTKNPNPSNVVDCHDEQGNILYKGTAKNCLEEMQIKFGPDIIFPSQQLFPKLYETARTQGANAQTALKQALSNSTCSELKAKETP